jgi:hypothetical protein
VPRGFHALQFVGISDDVNGCDAVLINIERSRLNSVSFHGDEAWQAIDGRVA